MRILEFNVKEQVLTKNPNCDFTGLVSGTKGYIKCKFNFAGSEWNSYRKVAEFLSGTMTGFYELDDQNEVKLPDKIADRVYFNVQVYGVNGNELIKTNKVLVKQERG